jgi:hypothetical protein
LSAANAVRRIIARRIPAVTSWYRPASSKAGRSGNSSTGRAGSSNRLVPAFTRVTSPVASSSMSSSVLSLRIWDSWLIGRMAAPARATSLPRSSYRIPTSVSNATRVRASSRATALTQLRTALVVRAGTAADTNWQAVSNPSRWHVSFIGAFLSPVRGVGLRLGLTLHFIP